MFTKASVRLDKPLYLLNDFALSIPGASKFLAISCINAQKPTCENILVGLVKTASNRFNDREKTTEGRAHTHTHHHTPRTCFLRSTESINNLLKQSQKCHFSETGALKKWRLRSKPRWNQMISERLLIMTGERRKFTAQAGSDIDEIENKMWSIN